MEVNTTINQTKNNSVNFLKAIACVCVVLIHTRSGWLGEIITALSRSAVAFFFVVAGYYSFNADKKKAQKKCIKKIIDTAKLCIFATIFFLLWGIFYRWVGTGLSSVQEWLTALCSWEKVSSFLFFQEDIFAGHLWFLYALFVCYVVNLIAVKFSLHNILSGVSIFLLAFMLVITNILPNFGIKLNIPTRNAWFYGIPIFMLANRLHWIVDRGKIKTIKKLYCNIAIIVLCGIIIAERWLIGDSQLYLGNILLVFLVFIYAIQNPDTLSQKQVCFIGENCSTNIYIFHYAIMYVLVKLFKMVGIYETTLYCWLYPIFTVILSIGFALCIYYIFRFIKHRFIEKEKVTSEK